MNALEFFDRYRQLVASGEIVTSIDVIIKPEDNVEEVEISCTEEIGNLDYNSNNG